MSATAVMFELRPIRAADRARIEEITRACGLFRDDEIPVALEVFDGALAGVGDGGDGLDPVRAGLRARPLASDARPLGSGSIGGGTEAAPYEAMVADVDGRAAGWICWGPTPCTLGTWDLYWMAVDPALQHAGIGTALIREMERRLTGLARLIVVETAGRSDYAGTRAFYEARGYHAVARIPQFYAPDDDQVVYLKYLTRTAQ